MIALAVVGAVVLVAGRLRARRAVVRNPQLVTIVPFRIASADPALHYLREGMLDLLSAKLPGEGGLQATDPRALLDAWRASGGTPDKDLRLEDEQKLSSRMGAGWLLLGDVVGTPSRVTLNATLYPTGSEQSRTRVSVDGPPDSLGALVDQLVGQLLTSLSAGTSSGPGLKRASLPVLRAYLDATSKLRNGLPSSVAAFSDALDRDTTFAPSALGLVQAIGWYGDGVNSQRPLRLAWQGRDQLNQKDQALLKVLGGPHYPAASSTRETFDAAQQYLQLAPDRADAWYNYGDKIYHFGDALGIADRAGQAATAFKKALATDSTYVPGFIHLQQLATELGDTALDQRLARLRSAIDTTGLWVDQQRWYRAVERADTATMLAVVRGPAMANSGLVFTVARMPLFVAGSPVDLGLAAYDTLIGRATTPGNFQALRGAKSALLLNAGRPAAALAELRAIPSPGRSYALGRQVLDAVLDHGDSGAGSVAVAEFLPSALAPVARDTAGATQQSIAIRAVLTWRLMQGDTAGAAAMIIRLKALRDGGTSPFSKAMDEISIATFEALLADRRHDSAAAAMAQRLDSLMSAFDYTNGAQSRLELAALVGARLLEKYQSPAAALTAIRRRSSWWSNEMPYLSAQLREEGRLAALAGQRAEAIDSYRMYLSLRSHADPAFAGEVAGVKAELAELAAAEAK